MTCHRASSTLLQDHMLANAGAWSLSRRLRLSIGVCVYICVLLNRAGAYALRAQLPSAGMASVLQGLYRGQARGPLGHAVERSPLMSVSQIHTHTREIEDDYSKAAVGHVVTIKREGTRNSRVDRVAAVKKLVQEISNVRKAQLDGSFDQDSFNLKFLDLTKACLFSGIPEQAIEVYAAYYDIVYSSKSTKKLDMDDFPVVPYRPLIVTTARAFLAMKDVKGALCLLRSARAERIELDANLKSLIMANFARTSPEGLKAALILHSSMKHNRERMTVQGYVGLLEGIWTHGMHQLGNPKFDYHDYTKLQHLLQTALNERVVFSTNVWVEYVEDESQLESDEDDVEGTRGEFMLTPYAGQAVARELYEEMIDQGTKITGAMNACLLRCVFRSVPKIHYNQVVDDSFVEKHKLHQLHEAFKRVVLVMEEYDIKWSYSVAHALLDESLGHGYKWGVNMVLQAMWENGLWAKTDTFNVLLSRYAYNGRGELALRVLNDKMGLDNTTVPDTLSYARAMEACLKDKAGRLLARGVFDRIVEMRETQACDVPKQVWDLNVALQIHQGGEFGASVELMSMAGAQPDESTVLRMIDTYLEQNKWQEVLDLYSLLQQGEFWRRKLKHHAMGTSTSSSTCTDTHTIACLLPPPTRPICNAILEGCRLKGDWKQALIMLQGMIGRYSELMAQEFVSGGVSGSPTPALTSSGALMQRALFGPNGRSFELALEACVAANQTSAALTIFKQMEKLGYKGDVHVYTSLVRAFSQTGDVSSAMGVFREMRAKFELTREAYEAVVDACIVNPNTVKYACRYLDEMFQTCPEWWFNGRYPTLLEAFPSTESISDALKPFFEENVDMVSGATYVVVEDSVFIGLLDSLQRTRTADSRSSAVKILCSLGIRLPPAIMEMFAPVDPSSISKKMRRMMQVYGGNTTLVEMEMLGIESLPSHIIKVFDEFGNAYYEYKDLHDPMNGYADMINKATVGATEEWLAGMTSTEREMFEEIINDTKYKKAKAKADAEADAAENPFSMLDDEDSILIVDDFGPGKYDEKDEDARKAEERKRLVSAGMWASAVEVNEEEIAEQLIKAPVLQKLERARDREVRLEKNSRSRRRTQMPSPRPVAAARTAHKRTSSGGASQVRGRSNPLRARRDH